MNNLLTTKQEVLTSCIDSSLQFTQNTIVSDNKISQLPHKMICITNLNTYLDERLRLTQNQLPKNQETQSSEQNRSLLDLKNMRSFPHFTMSNPQIFYFLLSFDMDFTKNQNPNHKVMPKFQHIFRQITYVKRLKLNFQTLPNQKYEYLSNKASIVQ